MSRQLHQAPLYDTATSTPPARTIIELCTTTVCEEFNLPLSSLATKSHQEAPATLARYVCHYVAHVIGGLTYQQIGQVCGKDRTSISYACQRVEEWRDVPSIDQMISTIEQATAQRVRLYQGR